MAWTKRARREPRDYQKQTFWLRSIEGESLNKDGQLKAFTPAVDAKAVWVSECRDCGGYFDQTLRYWGRFKPDRRCPTCSAVYRLNIAMGIPVKPFPLPKPPPTAEELQRRAEIRAKRAAKRAKVRERQQAKRAKARERQQAKQQAKRAATRERRKARRLAARQRRQARAQLVAQWRAEQPAPQKCTPEEIREAARRRQIACRARKRAALGLPPPREYKKHATGRLNEKAPRAA